MRAASRCSLSTSAALSKLAEVRSATAFPARLDAAMMKPLAPSIAAALQSRAAEARLSLDAAMATTHLHTQSRIAAYEGEGFYTIGPCGEELLSTVALALRPTDPIALHYRHLGTLVARQLQRGVEMRSLLLDRARGYTIALSDTVTGGVHCSLGGDPGDISCRYPTQTLTHAHSQTRTHAHTHTRTHAHTNTRSHTHTLTRTHAHTGTRTHAHTHTRTYTCTRPRPHACSWPSALPFPSPQCTTSSSRRRWPVRAHKQ